MNAAVVMQTCPNDEQLAAFIDARLDERARLQVIEHLADCGECRDVVMTANEYEASLEQKGGAVVPGRFNWRWIAPFVAAAAVVGVLFGVPSIREQILPKPGMEELVEVAKGLPKRPTEARLSADFAYRRYSVDRGGGDPEVTGQISAAETAELNLEILAIKRAERAERNPSPENLHQLGVADLFVKKQRNEAVTPLERAAESSPNSAEVLTDLTAAYIAVGDYQRAYDTATRAWAIQQSPITAWNRALALERLRRNAEAIAAWNEYLKLDSNSEWAGEVTTTRLPNLQDP